MKLPIDPKKELFRWGPIPGRFFYASVFCEINYKYFCQKYLGENWPPFLFLFRHSRMVWINEQSALRAAGQRVFVKYMLPLSSRRKIYAEWKKYVLELAKLEKKIGKTNLKTLNNQQLLSLWNDFHEIYLNFWLTGTVPELGNYGADTLLEEKLKKYIKNEAVFGEVMEELTAPEEISFYQEEEIDLFKAKDLSSHQQRYFWLKNSYLKTMVLPVSFFTKRKGQLSKNLLRDILEKIKKVKQNKQQDKKKYHLSQEVMNIATGISNGITWQDERKKYIFIALHYQGLMLKEIALRFGYEYDDLLNAWFWEIADIIKKKNYHQELARRRRGLGVYFYKNYKNLLPREVKRYWKIFGEEQINKNASEVKGLVVSKGQNKRICGKVCILLDPGKIHSFHKGEILVAPMTSPEYIFAMKRAVAVITDAGGMTSHAAVVSRELGIPCIVGTKIATQFFKDGDLVEVDAIKGVVRKLK